MAEIVDVASVVNPVITVIIMLVMMALMVFFFNKKKIFVIILVIHLFSLIIGVGAMDIINFPFTPWFQTFFIIFQTIFLLITAIEVFRQKG